MVVKRCKGCGEEKPSEAFYPNKTAAGGGNVCRACKRVRDARSREKNRDAIREQAAAWREQNRDRMNAQRREHARRLRDDVMGAYGGACACCGEATPEFLTLDHIGGGGAAHRRATHGKVYAALKREGYPPGYRILCWNCNAAHGLYSGCPHDRARAAG